VVPSLLNRWRITAHEIVPSDIALVEAGDRIEVRSAQL
jgi:hypothetical protein